MHPVADLVKHVVDVVDVDGVVRRIDVNDVVQRVDVNHLVSRVDWNMVLSKVDWNEQLDRIDVDAVLKKIDTSSIIARSSTGIFSTFMDSIRTQLVLLDLNLWILTRCRFWRKLHRQRCYLPPMPGPHLQRHDKKLYPKGRANKAVEVQGRYCGFVSKAIAMLIDTLTVTLSFAFMFRVIEWCLVLFLGDSQDEASMATDSFKEEWQMLMLFLYGCQWFAYFFLTVGLAGQTLGMLLVGLKVCNCDRNSENPFARVTVWQAFLRTCLLPVTLTLFPPLCVIGLWRRDGRMLHDLTAKSGIIYLWDAKLAKLRSKVLREEGGEATGNDDERDALDIMMESEGRDGDDENYDPERLSFLGQEAGMQQPDQDSKSYYTL
jgi:uncharacterized RDD family membrane protein YckC